MIEVNGVSFSYKGKKVKQIEDIDLKVETGYMTCLIGHNGSGKTTLMKLIYGCLVPAKGNILWEKRKLTYKELYKYRNEVAFVTNDAPWVSGKYSDTIDYYETIYPDFKREEFAGLIKRFGVAEEKLKLARSIMKGGLSSGEEMILKIAAAFARHPKYMILDEPFANLDPVAKIAVTDLLHERILKNEMGALVSTHLLDEITDVVDYVAVIEKGRLVKYADREKIIAGEGDLSDVLKGTKKDL